VRYERLHAGHEVAAFRCGDADLDLFLTRYAARNQDRLFVGTTYVAVDGETVAGYVTVALAQLDRAELPAVTEDPGGAAGQAGAMGPAEAKSPSGSEGPGGVKGPATQAVRLPRYPLPALRLARLAVDQAWQGGGLGSRLVAYALAIALQLSSTAGCVGVVVDALPDSVGFYAALGFSELQLISGHSGARPAPVPMFLPISAVAEAVAAADGVSGVADAGG
jgi:GNAT superfamily N-acetyltransferase